MEVILSLTSVALVTLVLWFVQLKTSSNHRSKKKKQLPPGPWELPIIGSLHHVVCSGMPPHHTLTELSRRHGPVMFLKLGENPTVVVSSAKTAEVVMRLAIVGVS